MRLEMWCFRAAASALRRDDHTRQCAAIALGVELAGHPQAEALIRERMQDVAREQGTVYEPDRPDNIHRLNMGVFPVGAQIIPNPYNKIAGFSCRGQLAGAVHFVPGFPVMAWPMMEWVLDTWYQPLFQKGTWVEQSVIVFGAMEATLTPLMEDIERQYGCQGIPACPVWIIRNMVGISSWASKAIPARSDRLIRRCWRVCAGFRLSWAQSWCVNAGCTIIVQLPFAPDACTEVRLSLPSPNTSISIDQVTLKSGQNTRLHQCGQPSRIGTETAFRDNKLFTTSPNRSI